jgi:hypothetical protein
MSKKNKRQVRKTTASPAPVVLNSAPVADITPARSSDREFNPDYSYVKKDLKRIGTLAGTFFAILIVLSFILKYKTQ